MLMYGPIQQFMVILKNIEITGCPSRLGDHCPYFALHMCSDSFSLEAVVTFGRWLHSMANTSTAL